MNSRRRIIGQIVIAISMVMIGSWFCGQANALTCTNYEYQTCHQIGVDSSGFSVYDQCIGQSGQTCGSCVPNGTNYGACLFADTWSCTLTGYEQDTDGQWGYDSCTPNTPPSDSECTNYGANGFQFVACTPPSCSSGISCGSCNASQPYRTCGITYGTEACQYTQPQVCSPGGAPSQNCSYSYDNCQSNYYCTNTNGANAPCATTVKVHAFLDYNHDGIQDDGEPNLSGVVMDDNGYTQTTDNNGNATDANPALQSGVTAYIQMTAPTPSGTVWQNAVETQSLKLTDANGNSTLTYAFVPVYSISGTVYNDTDLSHCYNPNGPSPIPVFGCTYNGTSNPPGGDKPYTQGNSHLIFSGPTNTTVTTNSGVYQTPQTLLAGSYTVSFDTSTTPLASGYRFVNPSGGSWTVTVGNPASGQAGYTCSVGASPDGSCTNPNNGSISNLDFGLSNETSWVQGVCSDMRVDSGYSEPIPQTASCNGTSAPYAIVCPTPSPSPSPANPGILYGGGTNPNYGTGLGPSTSGLQVGNSLYPEFYTPRQPNTIETSYNFVMTTLQNLQTPPTPLGSICPDLQNCTISNSLTGGVYTTQPSDGAVSLSVQNADGSHTLGQAHYTFVIGGDLTFATPVLLPSASSASAAFISGGDIHVAGSVGESDWNSLNPDLEGIFSADKNFDLDRATPSGPTCNADGSPIDLKLNIQGSVITNAALGGGSVVNNREGCLTDLSCPTATFQSNPLQMLNLPTPLKIPYTFWQEVNP